jgi:hypothetical protein
LKNAKQPAKVKFYYYVFSTKFNLHFELPTKDSCWLCNQLQMMLQNQDEERNKNILKTSKNLHLVTDELIKQDKHFAMAVNWHDTRNVSVILIPKTANVDSTV